MADVAGGDNQPMLQRGRGDQQIITGVTDSNRKLTPPTRNRDIDRQDPICESVDKIVQPGRERLGKCWIDPALTFDAASVA